MIVVAVLLGVDTLSMLAGVLEYKSIEGYPGAMRALDEAIRLDVLDGVRVRDRMVPCRFFAHKQVTVRTRGKEMQRTKCPPPSRDQVRSASASQFSTRDLLWDRALLLYMNR